METKHAEFSQSRNDMYWSIYCNNGHFKKVRWIGYDDNYWWNNVANREDGGVRQCECGKKYKINYHSNEVSEIR